MQRILALACGLLAGIILLSTGISVKAAGGDLDPTFIPATGEGDRIFAIIVQADGKIIVGGQNNHFNSDTTRFLARLNADGSLDSTFNPGTGPDNSVGALAAQPDGKVIIGGAFVNYNGVPRSGIARINSDGTLDTTFDPGAGTNGSVASVTIQADGKIIIGGFFSKYNGVPRNNIARVNPDGSLDTTFNPGTAFTPDGKFNPLTGAINTVAMVHDITLQSDGKIIAVGFFNYYNGTPRNQIARLNSDGSIDDTFNSAMDSNSPINAVALQPNGKIIIGGKFNSYDGIPRSCIARLNANGSLDTTFNPGAGTDRFVDRIVLQADGKIIIGGGFTSYDNAFRSFMARLSADGSLDPTFNPDKGPDSTVLAINIQADGKIIIGGIFATYNGIQRYGVARLLPSSSGGFSFSSSIYIIHENDLRAMVTVNRVGDLSQAVTVDYATSDAAGLTPCNVVTGMASQRCDYQMTAGTLRFAPGETSKTIYIPIVDDAYVENSETFNITLSNPVGTFLDLASSSATVKILDNDFGGPRNPIDDNAFFVRQLYLDFLNREPDEAGFAGWLKILNNCGASIAQPCDRTEVALDFFRSPEFQDRGYFIYRTYRASLGRIPHYNEFIPDMARISGFLNAQELEASKTAFIQEFVNRPEFQTKYGSLSNSDYVNKLEATAMVSLPNKQALIDDLQAGRKSRAEVLRAVIETSEVYAKYFNEAFIVMEYFGFLRRDPDAAFQGWVDIFNHTASYRQIINGFINSVEYRQRFGP